MQYKIIVDKQSRTNPSAEKKEYIIDIEELRYKGNVYDSLVITKDEDYVMRRLELTEYHVLNVLAEPIKQPIKNLNIELFEGDNYIYLIDMTGNRFFAEYIIKNEFTDTYITKAEFNSGITQTAKQIELSVNEKLIGYSTTEEMNSTINQTARGIELSVNQKFTDYSTTEEMNTAIKLESDNITSSVSRQFENVDKSISTMNSKIVQTADSITSTVSKTYATKTELTSAQSEIKQTTDNISSTVSKKVGNDEIISKINQSAEEISINADKINIDGKAVHFKTDISKTVGPFTTDDSTKIRNYIMGTETLTTEEIEKYDINGDGEVTSVDYMLVRNAANNGGFFTYSGSFEINPYSSNKSIALYDNNERNYEFILSLIYNYIKFLYVDDIRVGEKGVVKSGDIESLRFCYSENPYVEVQLNGEHGGTSVYGITAWASDKRLKTNIKDAEYNALEKLKLIKHRQFDYKNGSHINLGYVADELEEIDRGLIFEVGNDKLKQPLINKLIPLLSKAIQEQQEQIEFLRKEIEKLKEGNK